MISRHLGQNFILDWILKIDRWLLLIIAFIIIFGFIMVFSVSPLVAQKINLQKYHFVEKQFQSMIVAVFLMLFISFLSKPHIKAMSCISFVLLFILLCLVPIIGTEIKGSQRWIYLFNRSLQPSEVILPFFAVINSMLLVQKSRIQMYLISSSICIIVTALFLVQPDVGLSCLLITSYMGQILVAGISVKFIILLGCLAVMGILFAYYNFEHVYYRVNNFLGQNELHYQAQKSLEAFANGGLFGQGPGEGIVKQYLPDSHTDFVFSVLAEEMGIVACILIVVLYAGFVIRSLLKASGSKDLFTIYTIVGLVIQFGLHAAVNMCVTLSLLPTKGMTLPFISYGGSASLASGITIGIILSLTRKKYGSDNLMQK